MAARDAPWTESLTELKEVQPEPAERHPRLSEGHESKSTACGL